MNSFFAKSTAFFEQASNKLIEVTDEASQNITNLSNSVVKPVPATNNIPNLDHLSKEEREIIENVAKKAGAVVDTGTAQMNNRNFQKQVINPPGAGTERPLNSNINKNMGNSQNRQGQNIYTDSKPNQKMPAHLQKRLSSNTLINSHAEFDPNQGRAPPRVASPSHS